MFDRPDRGWLQVLSLILSSLTHKRDNDRCLFLSNVLETTLHNDKSDIILHI